MNKNKYVEEGKKKFNPKSLKYVNPYNIGTQEYNYFERGWTQALKRCQNYKLPS